jgi:IS30 family transposase
MKNTYIHLSSEERDEIAYLRAKGKSISDIARVIGRNKGTISRKLQRNKSPTYNVYLANRAHQRAVKRKQLFSTTSKNTKSFNTRIHYEKTQA